MRDSGRGRLPRRQTLYDMSRVLILLIAIAGAVIPAAQAGPPDRPLRIGTNIWPGYEPLYLARQLKYLNGETAILVEYLSASEVMRAFRNGQIEVAALTMDEVLTLLQYEPSLRVILVTDISDGGDAIIARPHINSLQELIGKRVGVEGSALGAYMLSRAMNQQGVDIRKIQIAQLDVNEHEAAYNRGDVDAVVTFDPVRTKLLSLGAKVLFTSREIPGEIVDVLVTRQQVIEKNTTKLQAIVSAWFSALDYLKRDPATAAKLMSKRLGMEPNQVLNSLEGLKIPGLEENRRLLNGGSPSLDFGIERLKKIMLDNALLDSPVNVDQLITPTLLD